jgi:hypothetical protein
LETCAATISVVNTSKSFGCSVLSISLFLNERDC